MASKHKKILLFDIDGTLITDRTHLLPDSAREAIIKAQENGHLAFVNTGRTFHTMPEVVKSIPFDGYLCGCGTRIIYKDEILLKKEFTVDEGRYLIDTMDAYGVEGFLEGTKDVYCKRTYRIPALNRIRKSFISEGFLLSGDIEDRNIIFDKFCLVTDGQEDIEGFFKEVSHMITPIDRGHGLYECLPNGHSKATAIHFIAKHLGFSPDDCYAFGDSTNDLPMFEVCGHSIAMKEHASELDPYCDFITDTVENDGIMKALQKIGCI